MTTSKSCGIFAFDQLYEPVVLRTKLFRHLLACETSAGHAVIDSAIDMVIKAHLQNLSRDVAAIGFGKKRERLIARSAGVDASTEEHPEHYCEHYCCCGS